MADFPGLPDYLEDSDILFDYRPWAILGLKKLAGYMAQGAVIAHKCDEFTIMQLMDEEDALRGQCWWCKVSIPEGVQFMWQMLNWDKLPHMRRYESDEVWEAEPPDKRYVKSVTQVSLATMSHQEIVGTGGPRNLIKKYSDTKSTMVWAPKMKLFEDDNEDD